jgi:hypothetical protein
MAAKLHAALGFKPRTGRAVLVALAGDVREPRVLDRREVPLLPPGEFAPYHVAENMEPAAARKYVEGAIDRARRLAKEVVVEGVKRCAAAGFDASSGGVLVGTAMPAWTTEEIVAVHIRMHKAEGEMFRGILVDAVRDHGLKVATLPDKSAIDAAAKTLGMTHAALDTLLVTLGKSVGAPWGKFEKEAAAAALVALKLSKKG